MEVEFKSFSLKIIEEIIVLSLEVSWNDFFRSDKCAVFGSLRFFCLVKGGFGLSISFSLGAKSAIAVDKKSRKNIQPKIVFNFLNMTNYIKNQRAILNLLYIFEINNTSLIMSQIFSYNPENKQILLGLKVRAGAKNNLIDSFIIINNNSYLKLSVKTIPENNKANQAVINFLSKSWKILKSNFEIINGHTNTLKILLIKNVSPDYLNSILSHYIK